MGGRALVVKDIDEGRLVAPYGTARSTGARFRFLCPEGTENRPQVKAFREWMLHEISKTTYITDALNVVDLEG